jgi:hypothetical protein
VIGTKGSCDVSGHIIRGENAWRFRSDDRPKITGPYQQEHHDLHAAIRNGTPYNEAENGAKSTMTAIMGRMATYSGKEVEWDKAINSEINLLPDHFAWDAFPKVLPDANGRYPVAVPGITKTV